MKQEREVLIEKLNFILVELNKTGQIKELLNSNLLDEYMNKGVLTKYLNTQLPLNNLNTYDLCHITRLVNSYRKEFDVRNYFTDTEISEALENKNNLKLEINPIIELKNVLYSKSLVEESWICVVTYKQIYEWMKGGLLSYNLSTQRKGVLRKVGRETIVVPYVNEKSIKEIKEAMLKEEFFANTISFNITPNYNHKLQYDPVNKTLRIDTSIHEVAITDGYHRTSGIISALDENKNLEGNLYLKITHMSIEKAQQFIIQEAKGSAQDLDYLEKYNPNNKIRMFIDNINNMGNEKSNALYRKIDMGVNNPDCWILSETFKEGLDLSGFLEDIENTDNQDKLHQMEKFIVQWFNGFYNKVKSNNIKIDEKSIYTDPTFIMGLLITCYGYSNTREVDLDAMDIFINKLKTTKTKYTYDLPMIPKEKRNMINKFSKRLEVI